jgi:hypothetical protein
MTKDNMPLIELLQKHDDSDFMCAVAKAVSERAQSCLERPA